MSFHDKCFQAGDNQTHKGEDHPNAKLDRETVERIWRLHHEDGLGAGFISMEIDADVAKRTLMGVYKGKSWTHVTDDLPHKDDMEDAPRA